MKRKITLISVLAIASAFFLASAGEESADLNNIRVYDHVVFYDGYLMDNNPDKDLQDGILRHSCSLYSKKLDDEVLDRLGGRLDMNVFVTAACDNYDRIGNINLAFVPKGSESYRTDEVDRIEIGRFITPFMDKNKEPSTVPYNYDIDYLSLILRDKELRSKYDIWLEFEIFGIPYAANEQIDGCDCRSDVFQGTFEFATDAPAAPSEGNILVPIVIKKPEYIGSNLNNYTEAGTDTIGKTTKTYFFTVPEDVTDAQLVLITSNHGANNNGEEYNRRQHFVYYDDELVLSYKPGRPTCEPFRKYNTQPNGIYSASERSEVVWQSFSNWCPGDVIDNRIIKLGAVPKGEHKVRITVPMARFPEKQGDIPVSLYFHGVKDGVIGEASIDRITVKEPVSQVSIAGGVINVSSPEEIIGIEIYSFQGEKIYSQPNDNPISASGLRKGMYLINIELDSGIIETQKIII